MNPRKATYKELAVYHSNDYLDFVLDSKNYVSSAGDAPMDASLNANFGLEDDCPPFQGLPEYVQLIAGAVLTAAEVLRQSKAEIAICWDGGRHHAQKSHASGFCYVADCILAILALKRRLSSPYIPNMIPTPKPRIMYLDLDLHFSDAVSDAFFSSVTPQVLTLSIHHTAPGFFPVSPRSQLPSVSSPDFDPFTLSILLHKGTSNNTYARIWPIVERVKDSFSPDFIIIQCGVDGLAGDPCATFNWSLGGAAGSLGWYINKILEWQGRKLLLGGGGYNSPNAARAWAYLTSLCLQRSLSLDTEIPDHSGFPLYAPSFTLDVPQRNMHDHNTDDYLSSVEAAFQDVIPIIQARLGR